MADFVFNIALGRVVELYNRVDSNDPTNAVLYVHAWVSTAADATLKDLDNLSLVVADVNTAEATNTNYAQKQLSDADLTAFAPDDGNDRTDLDIPDQTWTSVTAGDNWTDLSISYDADSTAGTDTDTAVVPLTWHDFIVSPNGGDITAQIAAAGFFRAQ